MHADGHPQSDIDPSVKCTRTCKSAISQCLAHRCLHGAGRTAEPKWIKCRCCPCIHCLCSESRASPLSGLLPSAWSWKSPYSPYDDSDKASCYTASEKEFLAMCSAVVGKCCCSTTADDEHILIETVYCTYRIHPGWQCGTHLVSAHSFASFATLAANALPSIL